MAGSEALRLFWVGSDPKEVFPDTLLYAEVRPNDLKITVHTFHQRCEKVLLNSKLVCQMGRPARPNVQCAGTEVREFEHA